MTRIISAILLTFLFISPIPAQTLLTYGTHKIEATDFLRAYLKNRTDSSVSREASMRSYLDLYVLAKMKVREAYARRYDTLPGIVQEVENLRLQLLDKYLADPVLLERLKQEAFLRTQTDREVAHIFISFGAPGSDSTRAQLRKSEVEKKMQAGADFLTLAHDFSDDPAVQENQGRIGFITAFTLPYDMETAIYQAGVGTNTQWVRSRIGYHLFRVLSERPAAGTIKARQIMLATPPGATEMDRTRLRQLADSIYLVLQRGASFIELARLLSNDYISAAKGGEMSELLVGQYDPVFEQKILALTKDNDLTAPFMTKYGWHIVQRISVTPPSSDLGSAETQQLLDQRVRADDRWRNAKDFIYEQVRKKVGTRRVSYNDESLWQYTDSLVNKKVMTEMAKAIRSGTVLFSIGKDLGRKNHTAEDWIRYASNYGHSADGSGPKPYPQLRNEWEQSLMVEYYKNNLESFNDEYRDQMTEFRDGNLFFEIMQEEIWNKAQSDTLEQRRLFQARKGTYQWKPSADVVLFFCADAAAGRDLFEKIRSKPVNWKNESLAFGERVFIDSARLEWDQIPNLRTQPPYAGQLLEPVINQTDNNASLAYILRVYPQPEPKTFEAARSSVISDLQTELDRKWESSLKKKYPVRLNERVFSALMK